MNTDLMFSSKNEEWETPPWLFKKLDAHYHFVLDAACIAENALCSSYYTKYIDSLKQDWSKAGSVWLNPPYGRTIGQWVKKAYDESQKGCTVVCLLPARTDTRWFHEYCCKGITYFLKGRLKFLQNGEELDAAPFPSMIVVFQKKDVLQLENSIQMASIA
jgi:site-specific DNA-methyltransferase (adenine-specific)